MISYAFFLYALCWEEIKLLPSARFPSANVKIQFPVFVFHAIFMFCLCSMSTQKSGRSILYTFQIKTFSTIFSKLQNKSIEKHRNITEKKPSEPSSSWNFMLRRTKESEKFPRKIGFRSIFRLTHTHTHTVCCFAQVGIKMELDRSGGGG